MDTRTGREMRIPASNAQPRALDLKTRADPPHLHPFSNVHHELFRRLFADPPPLVTTALVLAEGHGWFLKRFDRRRALQFIAFVEELQPLRVIPIGS
jgi:hypothetical protein